MKKSLVLCLCVVCLVIVGCNSDQSKHLKPFNKELPTIGLLMYNGVLQGEVIATSDVFAKLDKDGTQLFNVIAIAETEKPITTEEGMKFVPDYTFDNCP